MGKLKVANPIRAFLFVASLAIFAGIALTGFDVVHWFLYLPAVFFLFAAISGICPGIIFMKKIFGEKDAEGS